VHSRPWGALTTYPPKLYPTKLCISRPGTVHPAPTAPLAMPMRTPACRQQRSLYNESGKTSAGRNHAKYDLSPLPTHIAGGLEVDARSWCRTKYWNNTPAVTSGPHILLSILTAAVISSKRRVAI